ncbi:metallophosphoesterase [bacterium]|nr:metallophosphoesterase [bacterium]
MRKPAITTLIISAILLLFSCTPQPAPPQTFTFAFMTDIHVQPERSGDVGFRQAIAKVSELQPDFVITGGDLIYDALDETEERSKMLYDLYKNVINDLKMPVYNTLGNHEIFGLYEKSGIDPSHQEYGKEMYKNRLGEGRTYYSFDYHGWHFVIIDAIGFTDNRRYYGHVDSAQLAWLEEDLKSIGSETPVVASLHIPLTTVYVQMLDGATAAIDSVGVVGNSREVLDVFDDYNLQLVLQGHLHCVEEIIYRDTHFITGGAVSGNWWRGPRDGFEEGFVLVTVDKADTTFNWEYIDYGWEPMVEEE